MIDILDSSFKFWVNETNEMTCAILYRQEKKWKALDCFNLIPYMCQTGRSVIIAFVINDKNLLCQSSFKKATSKTQNANIYFKK